MSSTWQQWLERLRPKKYGRKPPLILINGLAEQAETWYRNLRFWRQFFDLYMPDIMAYDGEAFHRRISASQPIDVDYLVEQFHLFAEQFVQRPPYHLVASSLGGKVAVELAHRYPHLVARIVLLCPSGMGDHEQLPFMEGVRHNDPKAVVRGVFYNKRSADPDMLRYYKGCFENRRWRTGLLKTVRGTMDHTVRGLLAELEHPTLLVSGRQDKIVDPATAEAAARDLPNGQFLMIPKCGHAPQIEKPRLINRLVVHFLKHPQPSLPGFARLMF